MAKSIEPVKIRPIKYTNQAGKTAPYAEITGNRVFRGKLLLNADVCAGILADGLNVLRIVVAEAQALAKPPAESSRGDEVAKLEAQLARAKAEAVRRTAPPPLDALNRAVEELAGSGRFNAESAPPEVSTPAQP